jgi:hypothetical protein
MALIKQWIKGFITRFLCTQAAIKKKERSVKEGIPSSPQGFPTVDDLKITDTRF